VTSTYIHPTSEFDHHEQIARAKPFMLVIHALRPTRLHRDCRLDIRMEPNRFLI
jgi:hypothetical protein